MEPKFVFLAFITVSLAACGGGGTSNDSSSAQSSAAYSVVAPTQGAQSIYSETLVDNLNNSVNRNIINTILAVNGDGTFSVSFKDPNNNIVKTGTVDHSFYPQVYNYTSHGTEIDRTIIFPDGTSTKCVASSNNSDSSGNPRLPGETIHVSYTETCGISVPISYKITSLYVGQESITIPAGTYLAYKFQDTIVYTLPTGTTVTNSAIYWRSMTNLGNTLIKASDTYTYSGVTPPQGATVSATRTLQSQKLQ